MSENSTHSDRQNGIRNTVVGIVIFITVVLALFINRVSQERILSPKEMVANGAIMFSMPREISALSLIDQNQLPFTKKRALVETTLFSKNPDLRKLQQKHKINLKKYGNYKVLNTERGIIPMALIEASANKRIMKIGTSAGMVRASSGYSMRKIANWISDHKGKTIKKNNLLSFKYAPNPLLDFFDKIFLRVIKDYPNKSPDLFFNLFNQSNHKSLIKFLSDKPSWFDIINILMSMPKRLMLKGLLKKK